MTEAPLPPAALSAYERQHLLRSSFYEALADAHDQLLQHLPPDTFFLAYDAEDALWDEETRKALIEDARAIVQEHAGLPFTFTFEDDCGEIGWAITARDPQPRADAWA